MIRLRVNFLLISYFKRQRNTPINTSVKSDFSTSVSHPGISELLVESFIRINLLLFQVCASQLLRRKSAGNVVKTLLREQCLWSSHYLKRWMPQCVLVAHVAIGFSVVFHLKWMCCWGLIFLKNIFEVLKTAQKSPLYKLILLCSLLLSCILAYQAARLSKRREKDGVWFYLMALLHRFWERSQPYLLLVSCSWFSLSELHSCTLSVLSELQKHSPGVTAQIWWHWEPKALPVCSLQGWRCCRSWAVDIGEHFSGWDQHWHLWPLDFGAAKWVQTKAALTKADFREEAVPICTVDFYFGAKNCGTSEMCEICTSFAVPGIWKQNAAVLPTNTSGVHTLFAFLQCWKVTSFFLPLMREDFAAFRIPDPDTAYNWAICQPVGVDCVSHMGLETGLLLTHPCLVKGENVLTESCIPVLFSYIWNVIVCFSRPKLFQSLSFWKYSSEQIF